MAQITIETTRGMKHTVRTRELSRSERNAARGRLDVNHRVRLYEVCAETMTERAAWGDCQDWRTRPDASV